MLEHSLDCRWDGRGGELVLTWCADPPSMFQHRGFYNFLLDLIRFYNLVNALTPYFNVPTSGKCWILQFSTALTPPPLFSFPIMLSLGIWMFCSKQKDRLDFLFPPVWSDSVWNCVCSTIVCFVSYCRVPKPVLKLAFPFFSWHPCRAPQIPPHQTYPSPQL